MNSVTVIQLSCLIVIIGIALPVQSIKVNITDFSNCDWIDANENLEHFVRFTDISYEADADGFHDVVHGKYYIPTVNTEDKLVNISMFRCKDGTTGRCMENLEDFYVVLHCERFHRDKTGPWSMLSDAMYSASKCGEQIGNFELINAQLKPEYLTNFMVHDTDYPRHRMVQMVKKNIPGTNEVIIRACINFEFTIVF